MDGYEPETPITPDLHNATWALPQFENVLENANSHSILKGDFMKSVALRWIIHFVGDMH